MAVPAASGIIRVPSILCVTATGAAAAAVTATLAAIASQYHLITMIVIQKFATALLTAAATPIIVTSTNLPAAMTFNFPADAAAQGTLVTLVLDFSSPLASAVLNTNTTIVCPATTAIIWNVGVYYYSTT